MILSDHEIKTRITNDKLLEFHDSQLIKYCGYELTLGKVVEPKTGEIIWVNDRARGLLKNFMTSSKSFVIEPSETMIVVTKEKLNMPNDLCATYGQLNRLANRGLMILNTSIIEPGYSGPLSCVLVNFSSQRCALSPGESIAKLNFHQIRGTPDKLFSGSFDHHAYEQIVSKNATNLPKSLLDIAGVEERVTEKVGAAVRRSLTIGGIIILILLLWSQLEAFLSGWIYDRTGLMSTTKQVELLLKKQQVENQRESNELRQKITELEAQVKNRHEPTTNRNGAKH